LRSGAPRGRRNARLRRALIAGCAAIGLAAHAQDDSGREAAATARDAVPAEMPAFPKEEDLVPFFVSSASDFKFFIDGKSIAIDGAVIGYTLVARSPEGVDNVSREAIRCSSDEYRIYATGHVRDRSWSQRATPWRHIEPASVARWRYALLRDYFCPGGAPIFTAAEGIDALQRGRHPLVDKSRF